MRIPDDESAKSQFGIIDDELEEQLRDILEANETEHGDIYVPKYWVDLTFLQFFLVLKQTFLNWNQEQSLEWIYVEVAI